MVIFHGYVSLPEDIPKSVGVPKLVSDDLKFKGSWLGAIFGRLRFEESGFRFRSGFWGQSWQFQVKQYAVYTVL
jgi:hypothetical protein